MQQTMGGAIGEKAHTGCWPIWRRPAITAAMFGILCVGLIGLPTPEGLSREGHRVLAVAAVAIGLWSTDALPMGLTGMLVVVLLALSGGVPTVRDALTGFAHPVAYFLISVLTIGLAVLKSGLAERVARFFCSAAVDDRLHCTCKCCCPFRFSPSCCPPRPHERVSSSMYMIKLWT